MSSRRTRKNFTALVSAVAIACGSTLVVNQSASAYEPVELTYPEGTLNAVGTPDGPGPDVKAAINDLVVQDGIVQATFSGRIMAPKPVQGEEAKYGEANLKTARVTLESSGGAFVRRPNANDFVWNDGVKRDIRVLAANATFLQIEIPNAGAEVEFSLTLPVAPDNGATEVTVAETTFGTIFPKTDWVSNSDAELVESSRNSCSRIAVQSHTFKGGGYGEWMGELWLGPNMEGVNLGAPQISVTGPDGKDLTRSFTDDYSISRIGQRPTLDQPPAEKFPYAFWQGLVNWPFDRTSSIPKLESDSRVFYAGNTWIPDGATIEIRQEVTDLTCNPQLPSNNRWESYEHQVYLSSGRTDLIAEASAVDTIVLNGPATSTVQTPLTQSTTANTTVTHTPSTTANTTVTHTPSTTANTTVTHTPSTTANTTVTHTPSTTANTTVTHTPFTTANTTVTHTPPTTANTTETITETASTTVTSTPTTLATEDCGCTPTTVTVTETAEPVTVTETEPTTTTEIVPAEPVKRGEIGDRVWLDEDGNGKEDPGEKTGIPGVTVEVLNKDGDVVSRAVTDKDGNWKVDVEPGDYTVRYVPGNNTPSDPKQVERTVTIKPGEKNYTIDLGILPGGSVGDRVWNDENGNGKQDEGEQGVENVVVLVSREGEPTRSAVTDQNGDWKIEGLNPNKEYQVRFIKPEGWEVTGKVPGNTDELGLESTLTLKPKEYNDTYDLGLRKVDATCDCEPEKPGTIGDRVWVDENGDGKEDPGEKTGVPGVTVVITDKEGNEVTRTVTDKDGSWKVDVTPGDYTVAYEPGSHTPSQPNQITRKITVEPGKKYLDVDLGILPRGTVGDRVWNDEDGDGVQDDNEKGLRDIVVQVSREGEPTRTTVTDENGNWRVDGLDPNKEYEVRFIKPEGWEVTGKVPGNVDEEGLISRVTLKPGERNDAYDLGLLRTPTTPVTVTEKTPVPTPVDTEPGTAAFLEKCIANATQSPFLYLAPIAVLGAVGGELARPYVGAINDQLAQVNAEIQAAVQRNTPDFGVGNRGADREDPFAEMRAQINAANRELQRLGSDPNIQRLGAAAIGVFGLIAAGTVIYDWCSNEPGEAKTALGGTKTTKTTKITPTTEPTK